MKFQGVVLLVLAIMCTDHFVWCAEENYMCPLPCNCTQRHISCDGLIPSAVPDSVTELFLYRIDSSEFRPKRFCSLSWKSITNLSILSVQSTQYKYFDLGVRAFVCLEKLHSFKLSTQYLRHFSDSAFIGLANVNVFELSNCKTIHWEDLKKIFLSARIFPRLTQLILSGSGIYDEILDFNQGFVNSLATRPISYIDLSFTNFIFNFSEPGKLCKTLTKLNDTGALMQYTYRFNNSKVCSSLRILDDSDSQYLRNVYKNAKCINDEIRLFFTVPFFNAVQTIYVDKFVTRSENFIAQNCTFHVFNNSRVTELHTSQNYLPNFDFKLINDKLEHLDISDNGIETINPRALNNLSSLLTLNLSKNALHKTHDTLAVLFKNAKHIQSLDLSSNDLSHIPLRSFLENTNLQNLVMSNNSLYQITFHISHLLQLNVLDLRNNNIKYLNRDSQLALEKLINTSGILLQVLLHGNPFSCSCANLQFLNWFARTRVFEESRHTYKCMLNGQNHAMDKEAVTVARKDCEQIKQKRLMKLLLITFIPICVSVFILAIIILHRRHKQKKLKQRFIEGRRHLRENATQFPVFLSYSSDDSDFVRCNILRQLQVCLTIDVIKEITHTHTHKHTQRERERESSPPSYPGFVLNRLYHHIKTCCFRCE